MTGYVIISKLTLRQPPDDTSILLSGEKERSVTQPPCVGSPSSTVTGEQKWSNAPVKMSQI